jgi:hypothetical protein
VLDTTELLLSCSATVKRLDVRAVKAKGMGAVLNNLVELVEVGVACRYHSSARSLDGERERNEKGRRTSRPVRVENRLFLALDRLGVVSDSLLVLLRRVELVTASLELEGEFRAGLRR